MARRERRQFFRETPRCPRLRAVFTLEAAVILPILVSFFVAILFFFRVMQVQIEVQRALDETGQRLAVSLAGDGGESIGSAAAAKALFLASLGDSEAPGRYVSGGTLGISLARSNFSGDNVRLIASYRIRLPFRLFRVWNFSMEQCADCRKWTGWGGGAGGGEENDDPYVYITPGGSVYHLTDSCTHLALSVRAVSSSSLGTLRNEGGGRYKKCERCIGDRAVAGTVYITNQGDRYHASRTCSGIKRTVRMVRLSQVGSRRPCSRCGAGGA